MTWSRTKKVQKNETIGRGSEVEERAALKKFRSTETEGY